jgi:FtsP/CotA-like multicopper oxidase with cupredoxin domain
MMVIQLHSVLVALTVLGLGLLPAFGVHAQEQTFTLAVQGRKVVSPAGPLRVRQGETVTLRWLTDEPVAIHLHGYEIEQVIKSETPTAFSFKAHATGRFPITAHGFGAQAHGGGHGDTVLVYLEVLPR